MPEDSEYAQRIQTMDRPELIDLYDQIESGETPGWPAGAAFEHLVLRAFQLEGARVEWPYPVHLEGSIVEQIDGAVHLDHLSCLVESKDYADPINIEPITKLRNQLARRPASAVGLVFARNGFTEPARVLAQYLAPHAVLLWPGAELKYALQHEEMARGLHLKYRYPIEHGLPDFNLLPRD